MKQLLVVIIWILGVGVWYAVATANYNMPVPIQGLDKYVELFVLSSPLPPIVVALWLSFFVVSSIEKVIIIWNRRTLPWTIVSLILCVYVIGLLFFGSIQLGSELTTSICYGVIALWFFVDFLNLCGVFNFKTPDS